jgi:CHAT domain-containing protein
LEDNILYLHEIYRTEVNADLVVLSACESNKGNIYLSEGVISLCRAYINAGAKSVISTHWWAHDETTKEIMVDFFKGVKNKLPLDEALRNSKLNYLKIADAHFAHPFYWANFVLVGNNKAIEFNEASIWSGKLWWLLSCLSLLLIFTSVIVLRKRKNTHINNANLNNPPLKP